MAIEALTNIRTVAGLQIEEKYCAMFTKLLEEPHKMMTKKSLYRGFLFGFSQAIQYFAWAMVITYGGYLVEHDFIEFTAVFT